MLASAAQRLMHLYAVAPCQRAVILAAGSEGYQLAAELLDLGITVAAIADLRPAGEPTGLAEEIRAKGVAIYPGHAIRWSTFCGFSKSGIDPNVLRRKIHLDIEGSGVYFRINCYR